VLAFVDLFGPWDPTLAFVMGGALAMSAVGFGVARRSPRPWIGDRFALPTRRDLDRDLILGATLFGVGWGLVGLCPGPALANPWSGSSDILLFVAAMIAGTLPHRLAGSRGAAAVADSSA